MSWYASFMCKSRKVIWKLAPFCYLSAFGKSGMVGFLQAWTASDWRHRNFL